MLYPLSYGAKANKSSGAINGPARLLQDIFLCVIHERKDRRALYLLATAEEGDWSCVDLEPVKALKKTVSLQAIKKDAVLRELPLVKQSRLSVTPLTAAQAKRMLELGG